LKLDKVYEATVYLGITSSTGDPEGVLTEVSTAQPTQEDITKALRKFTGDIEQTPPVYSAIKIGGERAYNLARKGKEVTMPTRSVTVYELALVEYAYPEVHIRAHVSSGTYIRSLAEDIGKELGVGAYCSALRRTRIGDISIEDADQLPEILMSIQIHNDDKNDNHE
jgi:tRNA pseudouridine55 synthase